MEIIVEYFDGCPNASIMAERARLALQQSGAGDSVVVRLEAVATPEDAARRGFHGSPTILIDGVDPFGNDAVPGTFACRTYETSTGAQGAPSVEQLALAIERASMPHEIGRTEVQSLVERGARLVEVLPAAEYEEDHLPGAINLPLRVLEEQAGTRLDRHRPVIVYCWDEA